MAQKSPAEKVAKFKEFAREHPKLLDEVRNHKRSWQEIYEEWDIFGEDHEVWDRYLPDQAKKDKGAKHSEEAAQSDENPESSKKGKPSIGNLFAMLEKIDYDKVQKNIEQLSGAMDTAQKVLEQFQKKGSSSGSNGSYPPGNQPGPFGPPGFGPYGQQGFGPPRPPMFGPYPPQQNRPPSNQNQNN